MKTYRVSVVVPKAKGEKAAISTQHFPADWQYLEMEGYASRAEALNAGLSRASGDYVWFLHADSRIDHTHITALQKALAHAPNALHYFTLAFYDGGLNMRLNQAGCWLRCVLCKAPFGDQGLCIARHTALEIGGFDCHAAYGEDHLFVRAAKRRGIALHRLKQRLYTSARRYTEEGWWRTTLRYQYLWLRQVWQDR